jgi:hypothetical protein
MIFAITTLISALSISLIAAYFSIIGLATIFPGSMYAVIAMGSVLEVGKIIASIWLHRNWKSAPRLIKFYLFSAILVLMGITSMGIFGFLSKSHIEHEQTAEKSKALVAQIENKIERKNEYIKRQKELIQKKEASSENLGDKTAENIKIEQEKIEQLSSQLEKDIEIDNKIIASLNNRLSQLNEDLDKIKNKSGGLFSSKKKDLEAKILEQKLERESLTSKINAADLRISKHREETSDLISKIRERVQEYQSIGFERPGDSESKVQVYNENISKTLDEIDELEQEKFNHNDGARQLEAEVGPIKYVAELISDFTGMQFDVGKAVRIVIIILIFVFDPLAILLVLAAHISLSRRFPKFTISEKEAIKKQSELEITKKILNQEESDIEERKKDIKQENEIIELQEDQIKKYKEKISENKEVLRKLKLKSEKEILEKEDTSEILSEIKSLEDQKLNIKKDIEYIKAEKLNILNRAEEAIKSAGEIKEVFQKHEKSKNIIESIKSEMLANTNRFRSIKDQISEIESENKRLKNRQEPDPNPALKNKISQLIDQKNQLLEENIELKNKKIFLIKIEKTGSNTFILKIPCKTKGFHQYTKLEDYTREQIDLFAKISGELESNHSDLNPEAMQNTYILKIKKIIDQRMDNSKYRTFAPDYKFIA